MTDIRNGDFGRFIGTSSVMQDVYTDISKIAPTDTPVFIEGESGTGKEICAEMIHSYSDRHNKPFIALNCAALPKNLIESTLFGHVKGAFTGAHQARDGAIAKAQNGTLFLDEIGDMPIELQAKILRFCQDYSYSKLGSDTTLKADIRLICASNQNMKALIEKKLFREDLYYRLYIANLTMPPLRQHTEDILDITHYYFNFYANQLGRPTPSLSQKVEQIFTQYRWPGNVRELVNTVRQIITMEYSAHITTQMLPSHLLKKRSAISKFSKKEEFITTVPLWKIEKNAIQRVIAFTNGNIPKAAVILDIAPSTIYRKIKLWETI